jgi:two-component system chemotaxis response regulator CheB
MFAERLNGLCTMQVKEAETGDRVMAGRVLIAPGENHMRIRRSGGIYQVYCSPGPKVNGHCPSVEVLMLSAAEQVGPNAIGVMLTGMGADGADAMGVMRKQGARTLAQDEKSSVVFGMPNEAYKRGGAERLVPLDDIAQEVLRLLTNPAKEAR